MLYDANNDGVVTKEEFSAVDTNNDGVVTKEEFNTHLNAKDGTTGNDFYTEEQKKARTETFTAMDTNKDGQVTTTEALKYDFQNGSRESLSSDDLKSAYGEETASKMMKFDKDGDGKLNAKEFDEATKPTQSTQSTQATKEEKKGFFDKLDFKNPRTLLAVAGIALTIIGLIIGLIVLLCHQSKKKKQKQENLKLEQQLKSGSVNQSTSVSTGNSAEKVHTPMSPQAQQHMNDAYDQYGECEKNNSQSTFNLQSTYQQRGIGN